MDILWDAGWTTGCDGLLDVVAVHDVHVAHDTLDLIACMMLLMLRCSIRDVAYGVQMLLMAWISRVACMIRFTYIINHVWIGMTGVANLTGTSAASPAKVETDTSDVYEIVAAEIKANGTEDVSCKSRIEETTHYKHWYYQPDC